MKKLALFLLTPFLLNAAPWKVDTSHAGAEFKVKHMMVSTVRGTMGNVNGTFDLDDKDITKTKIDVNLDAATISTNNADRDTHLKGKDFFNVEKNPKVTFVSTEVKKGAAANEFTIKGNLTMNGVTKPVTLKASGLGKAVKDPWGNMRKGFTAETKISRKDFGMTWNKAIEAGGVAVSDDVIVTVDLELIQPKS